MLQKSRKESSYMTSKYARAYTEVVAVLNNLADEEYSRIPEKEIEFYKNNMDKEYNYSLDPEKSLAEQNISIEANAILVTIFRDYFATEKQKETLNNILIQNQNNDENLKREKYNPDNIFDKNESTNTAMVEYKESILVKILNRIKCRLFK